METKQNHTERIKKDIWKMMKKIAVKTEDPPLHNFVWMGERMETHIRQKENRARSEK
jgi:hypothetical protein